MPAPDGHNRTLAPFQAHVPIYPGASLSPFLIRKDEPVLSVCPVCCHGSGGLSRSIFLINIFNTSAMKNRYPMYIPNINQRSLISRSSKPIHIAKLRYGIARSNAMPTILRLRFCCCGVCCEYGIMISISQGLQLPDLLSAASVIILNVSLICLSNELKCVVCSWGIFNRIRKRIDFLCEP